MFIQDDSSINRRVHTLLFFGHTFFIIYGHSWIQHNCALTMFQGLFWVLRKLAGDTETKSLPSKGLYSIGRKERMKTYVQNRSLIFNHFIFYQRNFDLRQKLPRTLILYINILKRILYGGWKQVQSPEATPPAVFCLSASAPSSCGGPSREHSLKTIDLEYPLLRKYN